MAISDAFTATGTRGAALPSRYAGATASGAPAYGVFAIGDFVIDRTGSIWVCTAAGQPGTWKQGGAVTGVTAADTSIVVGGTAQAPTIATATLDVIAADHPPAADWSNSSHKITSLANGSAATDAAAFGQLPPASWPAPAGAIAQTIPPNMLSASSAVMTSGTLYIAAISLLAGQVVSNITWLIGTTAGAGLTHGWFALLDSSFKQQAHTADQTSGGLAASTLITKPVVTPYTAAASGLYWAGIMVVGTGTQPNMAQGGSNTLQGTSAFAAFPTSGPSSTGQTTPGTDNSTTYIAPSSAFSPFYGYVS